MYGNPCNSPVSASGVLELQEGEEGKNEKIQKWEREKERERGRIDQRVDEQIEKPSALLPSY